jgi:hypothetical protein
MLPSVQWKVESRSSAQLVGSRSPVVDGGSLLNHPVVSVARARALEVLDIAIRSSTPEWRADLEKVKASLESNDIRADMNGSGEVAWSDYGRNIWFSVYITLEEWARRLPTYTEKQIDDFAGVLIHETVHQLGERTECKADNLARHALAAVGAVFDMHYGDCAVNDEPPALGSRDSFGSGHRKTCVAGLFCFNW